MKNFLKSITWPEVLILLAILALLAAAIFGH